MRMFHFLMCAGLVMAACEKPVFDDDAGKTGGGKIQLKFSCGEGMTRSVQSVSDVCSRLNVAVFAAGGEKVKSVVQKAGDADFGNVSFSLAEGSYEVVAVAHGCDGSATITSREKVTFPNNKVTDTFVWRGMLAVGEDDVAQDCSMWRAVACIRFKGVATLPPGAASLKFYYLGGSSTFSPADDAGSVNSKQTEVRAASDVGVYEIYTFPHTADDVLTKVVVSALNEDGDVLSEVTVTDIPIVKNKVTVCECDLFSAGGTSYGGVSAGFYCETEWAGIINYNF